MLPQTHAYIRNVTVLRARFRRGWHAAQADLDSGERWRPACGDRRRPPLVGRLLDGGTASTRRIARGGMATVFLATDTRLDRPVAVKVMHPALAEDPEFVARFTREAKASARLSSAEVVAVHDQGTDPSTGLAYLVMEHVRGINLRQLLLERGPLPPARAVSLLEPVLRALAAAHAAGLVHRDIKPENVLLADDGRVKVADFGLARAVETSNLTQTTGLLIGTVAYLAPEQVEHGYGGCAHRRLRRGHAAVGAADRRSAVLRRQPAVGGLPARAPGHPTAVDRGRRHPCDARRPRGASDPPRPGRPTARRRSVPRRAARGRR